MNKRKVAITTGWSLILMAIIAMFSVGYAFSEFYQADQIEFLNDNILKNLGLYRSMLWGILIIIILDLLVSFTLYEYFKDDNRKMSLASGILRLAYTFIFGIATFFLTKNLNVTELTNQTISTNFQLFQSIWNGGLIVFGFHIILIGILMKLHSRIPKILWYLALIAGVSYVIIHFFKLISPDSEFVNTLNMILALPMAIGELGLAIWLLVKGGRKNIIKNETSLPK
ncbi:MAG: DUF4386 domain-containing protein [Bacteroidetes bacterium]|nr:DUF4386 domain-containing protein [Bacteroidota bacterium]MBT6685126.1 DUF4386 domain-containing protein [Bacteroidota bacterium]MBT7142037.1 DUF4386 domain-containing protein [Bacteroidota bacterium]MBT7493359.1 DUF4386 domain-containing protein [Bacteroidota bacterium]